MFADEQGVGVTAESGNDVKARGVVERTRDLIILRLDRRGLSLSEISRIMNLPKTTVHRRINSMPPEVLRHYGESRLDWLDSA